MKTQHTQGEWTKSNPAIGNKRLFTIHSGKLLIAKTCDYLDRFNNSLITPEQAQANANLIAAAPEMLKELKSIVEAAEKNDSEEYVLMDQFAINRLKKLIKSIEE